MNCPKCNKQLKEIEVSVEGATKKVKSFQCPSCDYFEFDKKSSKEVIEELRETPLKISQKIIKLSGERLGMYFTNDVVRSLGLKKGEEVKVSVPDKKHIVIELS